MTFNKKEYAKEYKLKNKEKIAKQNKEYWKKPENKARAKEYDKKYRKRKKRKEYRKKYDKKYYQIPKVIVRTKEYQKEYNSKLENIEKRKKWSKEYNQKFENKIRINANDKQRRKTDKKWAIKERVRSNFNMAMKKYSTIGKVMSTSKYLDMNAIIKKLTPFPKDIENYEVDHIIPLKMFNHDNLEQARRAWLPSNLQWLTVEANRTKGNKLVHPDYYKKYGYNPKEVLQ